MNKSWGDRNWEKPREWVQIEERLGLYLKKKCWSLESSGRKGEYIYLHVKDKINQRWSSAEKTLLRRSISTDINLQ